MTKHRSILTLLGMVATVVIAATIGFIAGVLAGERGAAHRQFVRERDALVPRLADDSFRTVEVDEDSEGGVYIWGAVADDETYADLETIVQTTLGDMRTEKALNVSVLADAATMPAQSK